VPLLSHQAQCGARSTARMIQRRPSSSAGKAWRVVSIARETTITIDKLQLLLRELYAGDGISDFLIRQVTTSLAIRDAALNVGPCSIHPWIMSCGLLRRSVHWPTGALNMLRDRLPHDFFAVGNGTREIAPIGYDGCGGLDDLGRLNGRLIIVAADYRETSTHFFSWVSRDSRSG
jgi:hypothetical protein